MINRQHNIDFLRFVCALFVVCIHCSSYSFREYILHITRIAVPIFFIISGYFLYSDNNEYTKSKIRKSIKKISNIYIISLIVFFIYALIDGYINNNFNALKIGPWKLFVFITNCSSLFFPYDFHLWFLIALVQGLILFYALLRWTNNHLDIVVIISIILIILNPIIKNIDINIYNKITYIPFSNVIFTSFPYLFIGYYIKSKSCNINNKFLYILLCLFTITSIMESMYIKGIENYFSTLFLSITVFYIFKGIKTDGKVIEFLGKLGEKHSLFIYISHVIVIKLLSIMDCNTNPLIVFIISLLLSCVFSYIKKIKYGLLYFKK